MASSTGRIRLNVTALLDEAVRGKFLVVVDEEHGMGQLLDKIQKTLRLGGIAATVERVLNGSRASLPHDEAVGDMLRDGEEIIAVLRGDDGRLMHEPRSAPVQVIAALQQGPAQQRHPGLGDHTVAVGEDGHYTIGGMPLRASVTLPPGMRPGGEPETDSEEEEAPTQPVPMVEDYPPPPYQQPGAPEGAPLIPGPAEYFEADATCMPREVVKIDHPCEPIQPSCYDNDWLVENLTPKLREFVLQHFQQDLITEPKYVPSIGKFVGSRFFQASGSFVSVFMRPQTAAGSDPNMTMPVHYNIAKHDISRFQNKAERHIEQCQQHSDLFSATMRALRGLLAKGMSETDHINVMLPHSYQTFDEVEGAMMEVDKPLFPKMDGLNPIIIIDTCGGTAKHLNFIKGALKRALAAHMTSKTSFQLVRFAPATGEPRLFAQGLVPPTQNALKKAEEWIDALAPCCLPNDARRLLSAVKCALAHPDCDEIHILSSPHAVERPMQDGVLHGIRSINVREVAIHCVGVAPDPLGELLLRNISESNHGDYRARSLGEHGQTTVCKSDERFSSWRTNLVNERSKQLAEDFKKQKMTIGSQIQIVDVMQREERQKEFAWREEWKCAQRLLLASEKQRKGARDEDGVRELERKAARTFAARVGGGFSYMTDQVDFGLESLFEHKSMVPWTDCSDSAAGGPKVPTWEANHLRAPKLPPPREPQGPPNVGPAAGDPSTPLPALRASSSRPRSARRQPVAPGNPWQRSARRQQTPSSAASAGGYAGHAGHSSARGPSSARPASADRAAGVYRPPSPGGATGKRKGSGQRSKSPASRERRRQPSESKLPPVVHQPPASAVSQVDAPPDPEHRLERRWSF